MVKVRPMLMSDLDVVAEWLTEIPLWQRYNLTRSKAQATFEKAFRQQAVLLVADTSSEHACAVAWCIPDGAFGRSAYLRMLGVRTTQSGQGIGSVLMQEVEHIASQSSEELFLLVSDFNTGAQRFYQRRGFQHIGVIPRYILPDVDENIYWKRFG
ncbi:MAG: GNAT family N-acetyltransferase [Chloroflexi bacterium]|nr:GNAT family N-acetyltransferase [Chloroflexota bacterium]